MTFQQLREHSVFKWLYPGMHIKRWLVLLLFGISLMGLGIAYLLKEAYLNYAFPGEFRYITLQFIPRWGRGLLFMSLSMSTIGIAIYKLNESLLFAFVRPERSRSMAQAIYDKRILGRGPKVVAIGGGTGLSTLLRGLKHYTSNLTAVYDYAERITEPGFTFMNTPGYDPPSLTGLAAGGCNVIAFTTGRGSAIGFPSIPVIKVATNQPMYNRMKDNMDINAGRIAEGEATIEGVGKEIFDMVLRVASGERTKAEDLGHKEFVPWRIGPVM